ncbi:MAG TPA: hypothetical protein ACFE0H_11780 [Elainellaceae cyanobacterium]
MGAMHSAGKVSVIPVHLDRMHRPYTIRWRSIRARRYSICVHRYLIRVHRYSIRDLSDRIREVD